MRQRPLFGFYQALQPPGTRLCAMSGYRTGMCVHDNLHAHAMSLTTALSNRPEESPVFDQPPEYTDRRQTPHPVSKFNSRTVVSALICDRMVQQTFSWGALEISEQMMRCVLRYMDASPAFARILHTFGNRRSQSSEASGIPALISSFDGDRVGKRICAQVDFAIC